MKSPLMKRFCVALLCAAALLSTPKAFAGGGLTQYIDPYIGSDFTGHVFVGANAPHGLVQLGPNEPNRGWSHTSGYHYSDSVIVGFGHMHLGGTGVGELGDIALLPLAEPTQREVTFTHDDEHVEAGYYRLQLRKPEVGVELTATQHVGLHRYTPASGSDSIFMRIDLGQSIGWCSMTECRMARESATRFSGYRRSKGWAKDRLTYFVMEFSQPVEVMPGSGNEVTIVRTKALGVPLLVKVALSSTGVDGARRNMQAELSGWGFEQTRLATRAAWEKELSRMTISTADEHVKRMFYTSMYHLMTAPVAYSDVDGGYRGADGQLHRGDFVNYSVLSLWDTYRAAHPLMTLIAPDMQRDFAETFMAIYDEQGRLPVWHLMGNETDCMVGSPAVPVLSDLTLKGFVADEERAFRALKGTQLGDVRQLDLLKEYGYIPCDVAGRVETVSRALEYCLADDGVARVAKKLGHQADYDYFFKRSRSYTTYFDPNTKFVRAVTKDRKFREPFDPITVVHQADDYTEGNAWVYTWLVPHDVQGLVGLFGGKQPFMDKLDSLFVVTGDMGDKASPDISGLIGMYVQGNEPSHHIIYLYNYIGEHAKAARMLRRVMTEMYSDKADGLCGNEDVGQMSAWYLLTAVGLYQVEPSGGRFVIGSPIVDKATLQVGQGRSFTILARNNSKENIYVETARLNGKKLRRPYLTFEEITSGGSLELTMTNRPTNWVGGIED